MQISAKNGDYITPTIVGTGENDYNRDLAYTRSLFQILTRDQEYGAVNEEVFAGWLKKWVPPALEASAALQPIWSQPAEKVRTFAESLDSAKQKFTQLLEEIGLDVPQELNS